MWLQRGKEDGAAYMIVAVDWFSHEDYPVYVKAGEDIKEKVAGYNHNDEMQGLMEVYDFSKDLDEQLEEKRSMNY
jgi:hypothetical protein